MLPDFARYDLSSVRAWVYGGGPIGADMARKLATAYRSDRFYQVYGMTETGITFAEALDSVITAASRKSAHGMDVFYVGDTKEKGLEFIGYCAKFSRVIAEAQASVSAKSRSSFSRTRTNQATPARSMPTASAMHLASRSLRCRATRPGAAPASGILLRFGFAARPAAPPPEHARHPAQPARAGGHPAQ